MEIWKNIIIGGIDYTGMYSVSSLGNVKNDVTGTVYRMHPNSSGYIVVSLKKNNRLKTYQVHRLVASAFIKNDLNYPEVNHLNSNKKDNAVTNLEWCSRSRNVKHYYETAKSKDVDRSTRFSLGANPTAKKIFNVKTGETYGCMREVANSFGMNYNSFRRRLSGVLINNTDFDYVK